jgi:hypothetical protein
LKTLLFLVGTFRLDDFVRVMKNEPTDPAPSDCRLQLTRAVIFDFFFRNWWIPFPILFDPGKNLLFTILIKAVCFPRCPGGSNACSSADITSTSNLLASEFDFLKNRVLSKGVADGPWDTKFVEAWQEDFE